MALKHHTSKLSSYSDLNTLETFGFRGEALSSMCALSKFTITTCIAADAPKGTKLDFEVSGKLKSTSVIAAQKGTTVSVENLFHNLPVRRRELERNIKREWNRVVGLLGQYACITTGVKMSVTQQAAKGKKATLFSTKGNLLTKENIVNVYGAKTLTALLTLNLKLELEPSSGPGQRRSTQDDGEAKQIHIIGHISRPAHGEGRQTPDRQMFFVNGRPCGLPQVSKAFNEVYKQFNSSQSPFIFANIEMDTHLYDVNVSPDKRTILLHDQTRMLEHLKISLVQLFDSQDHTVPISQISVQKQPSYKQLTIARTETTSAPKPAPRPPTTTTAPTSSNASTDDDDEEEVSDQPGSPLHKQDSDGEEPGPRETTVHRPSARSRNSMNRDVEAVSLIGNWLEKKTEGRRELKEANPKPAVERFDDLSMEKRLAVKKLANEAKGVEPDTEDVSDEAESSDEVPESTAQLSGKLRDFNRRIAGHKPPQAVFGQKQNGAQEPIAAITSPPRRVTLAIPVGTTPTRAPRIPATVATITIGDHTTTSSIGSPYPKKARVESPSQNRTSALPSFGSRLSQRFAASGSSRTKVSDDAASQSSSDNESTHSTDDPETETDDAPTEQIKDSAADILMLEKEAALEQEDAVDDESDIENPQPYVPEDEMDDDYVDEDVKKVREEAKIAEMIKVAEEAASRPSGDNTKRASLLLKGGAKRKDATVHLMRSVEVSLSKLKSQTQKLKEALDTYDTTKKSGAEQEGHLDSEDAEEKLSLTINKTDFARMKIIGQFNLGFILASRTSTFDSTDSDSTLDTDDLFIIDQHASDEKYNFERLQASTIVQSQRLVRPKILDLTAIEEEIVKENLSALEQNGFIVTIDESGDYPVGQRCQLVSLPLSRETTFALSDLEELISLLSDHPAGTGGGSIPRPSKVRKMFAMRACRSSIMIGRTLTHKQMGKVVKNMGEIDKPWNCPHGRPTMRHLCGLGAWDEVGWREGDGAFGDERVATDWAGYVESAKEGRE